MKKKCILTLIALTIVFTAIEESYPLSKEDRYYRSALKATFMDGKSKEAGKLGRLGTKKAKKLLIKLLNNDSYWNRTGAVAGLFVYNDRARDPDVGERLLDKMITDHMIDDVIEKGLKKRIRQYFSILVKTYNSGIPGVSFKRRKKEQRERIIAIISSSKIPQGEAFLKKIIENGNSKDRAYAFKFLSLYYIKGNYGYIKKRRHKKIFRVHALAFLVKNGTKKELELFLGVIKRKEKSMYQVIAYKGVQKWGSVKLKHKIFLNSLKESDETLVRAGLLIFESTRSKDIKLNLFRLIKKGKSQSTRLSATMRLTEYRTKDVIPYLVISLDERFMRRERGGVDMALAAFTFGITSIFDDLNQKSRKSSFSDKKRKIINTLKKITRVNKGGSYKEWSEWAVLNGYTINGINIIQFLFSGNKKIRKKAIESSIRLLGFRNNLAFYKKHHRFDNETELSLFLAGLLIKKGYLVDEE
ncbi:MAG: hypothetical protein GY754_28495 [bacterium]|nr:hypothetical protein [bacterium]